MVDIQDLNLEDEEDVPLWKQEELALQGFTVMLKVIAFIAWLICLYFFLKTTAAITCGGILYFLVKADKETLQQAGVKTEQR
jgi:predicted PurR-regulated permease PerM